MVRAKKIMLRTGASFQKAWLDQSELLKTPSSQAKLRADPRLDPALQSQHHPGAGHFGQGYNG